MNNCTVFIMSADSYSDLWPIFFDLFKKYWPEFNGRIYLQTEEKSFSYPGLDIQCTLLGKQKSFGKHFRSGLNKIPTEQLLLITIDSFFMERLNNQLIEDYYGYFIEKKLDSLYLMKPPNPRSKPMGYKDLYMLIPPNEGMFNFQIAFWNKKMLFEMVLPHETPWLAELYGMIRANIMNVKEVYPNVNMPINYLPSGALHKGKWVKPIVEFLEKIKYKVDFSERGFFEETSLTLTARIKARLISLIPRLLSNIDLLKRRYKYNIWTKIY